MKDPYLHFDDYAFQHLPRHLAEAGETEVLFSLMNNEFCLALRKHSKTDLLFTSHLSFAQKVAFEQGNIYLLQALHMMFMEVGLRSTIDSISPSIIMLMTRVGDVERALDTTELIRLYQVKGVAIILVCKALEDLKNHISQNQLIRLLNIAEVTLIGDLGIAVLIAIARLYTALSLQEEATNLLDRALRIAKSQLASPILETNIASVANAYVNNNNLDIALEATNMDKVGVDVAPIISEIAAQSYAQGNLVLAQEAVERMVAIPEWVSGHHGLMADDVFRVADLALKLGKQDLYSQLLEKAHKTAEEVLGVKGLSAQTLQAYNKGELDLYKELLSNLKQKAEEQWGANFKAEAWFEITKLAHRLRMIELREEAMKRCISYIVEASLYSVYDTVLALVDLFEKIELLDEASVLLQRIISSESYKGYDKDYLFRIAILKAEKYPDHSSELLQLKIFLLQVDAPPYIMAEYGMALARSGRMETAQELLKDLEGHRPISNIDPALSLLFGNFVFETQQWPEFEKTAQDWWRQTQVKIGMELGSDQLPENCEYISKLDWIVGQMLINTPPLRSRSNFDFSKPSSKKMLLDKEESYLRKLTPSPQNEDHDPYLLMQKAIDQEASMGDSIGMVGESIVVQLAQAAAGYVSKNDFDRAIEAVHQIQYWRIQSYIRTSPMDAEDFGAYQKLFNMGCIHAGAVVLIAASIKKDTPNSFYLFSHLLEETARLPHDSTRYAARKLITRYLKLDDVTLLEFTRMLLKTANDESRDEFLSCLASWVPVLLNLGGPTLIKELATYIDLVSTPVVVPYLPRVTAFRPTGGQLRTFNIVRD